MRSLDEAESHVRKYESRLSEEDVVPADTSAIRRFKDQLAVKHRSRLSKEATASGWKLHPPLPLRAGVAGRAGRAGGRLPGSAVGGHSSQRGGVSAQQAPPRPQPRAGTLPGESQSAVRAVARSQEADGDTVSPPPHTHTRVFSPHLSVVPCVSAGGRSWTLWAPSCRCTETDTPLSSAGLKRRQSDRKTHSRDKRTAERCRSSWPSRRSVTCTAPLTQSDTKGGDLKKRKENPQGPTQIVSYYIMKSLFCIKYYHHKVN